MDGTAVVGRSDLTRFCWGFNIGVPRSLGLKLDNWLKFHFEGLL